MKLLALSALAVAALSAPLAQAGDYKLGALTVQSPWSRPAQAGMNGVGFMTILNTGSKPVALTGVETALAGKAELHLSSMAGGVMTMRRQDRIEIAPGGKLSLAPGGYHLMLLGLKQPLKAGQKAPITLIFDNGRRMAVEMTVQLAPPPAAKDAGAAHDHH
jgi:copper(I)-binding protein